MARSRPSGRARGTTLVGRGPELLALDSLLDAVGGGESRALVIHGDPGVGKTALLDYLAESASHYSVVGVAGVEAEMELPLAALHQLCAPMLDRLGPLPAPQRQALEVTFGISTGPVPERLLLGLAVLSLMSELVSERPLLCRVDDAQWLDRESAQILAFVARRLGAESIGIVIGTRQPGPEFAGLPELVLKGLPENEARALLTSVLTMPVDKRVLDQFVAETQGNPLALLELNHGLSATASSGGFELPAAEALSGSIEDSFRRRVSILPAQTQRLLLLAAAEPLGDPILLWRAAEQLGIEATAARPAVEDDLIAFDARVRFRHPLVRSAVYRAASLEEKREAHAALAEVTDSAIDPERRVWHRAQAAACPDEDIAAELEHYAERAQSRGGLAAAAAFLERATALSPDQVHRAARALAAGQAKVQAGAYDSAQELLAVADAGQLGELDRARLDLARARLAFATNRGSEAPALLLTAAQRMEPIDADLARSTYLDALMAAFLAGGLAAPDATIAVVARAAAAAPAHRSAAGPADLLIKGLAANYDHGYAAGLPSIRSALTADNASMPSDQELRWLSLASPSAIYVWDDAGALVLSERYVRLARQTGALSELVLAINSHAILCVLSGDPGAAALAVEEAYAAAEALHSPFVPHGAMGVAACQGAEAEAVDLIEAARHNATMRGEGSGIAGAAWAAAVLNNSLGRYDKALTMAQQAVESANQWVFGLSNWALVELVEAAARAGRGEMADGAVRRLGEMAAASQTDWALGVDARSRALVSRDDNAEKLFRESIDRLAATRMPAELARAHLLFGEWLRRQRRRTEARGALHAALEMLEACGMEAFAERARRELRATGETARRRRADTAAQLTAQEAQVARLARDGLSNPEIGARLYISARTVQYHLGKVFAKLDITSRTQLDRVL